MEGENRDPAELGGEIINTLEGTGFEVEDEVLALSWAIKELLKNLPNKAQVLDAVVNLFDEEGE